MKARIATAIACNADPRKVGHLAVAVITDLAPQVAAPLKRPASREIGVVTPRVAAIVVAP